MYFDLTLTPGNPADKHAVTADEILKTLTANGITPVRTLVGEMAVTVETTKEQAKVLTFLSQAGMGYIKLNAEQQQKIADFEVEQEHNGKEGK